MSPIALPVGTAVVMDLQSWHDCRTNNTRLKSVSMNVKRTLVAKILCFLLVL